MRYAQNKTSAFVLYVIWYNDYHLILVLKDVY